jgi:hypothetical protein
VSADVRCRVGSKGCQDGECIPIFSSTSYLSLSDMVAAALRCSWEWRSIGDGLLHKQTLMSR